MATIYLHIGAPKTATSTLQSVLAKNHKTLLKNGVLYPRDMRTGNAHHLLVCDLIEKYQDKPMPDVWYGEHPRGLAWEALLAEIKRHESSIHSVILSSELFLGQNNNLEPILESVSTYLQGHEIRVVVYLRRQDQLYSSFYNQDVKGVRQWSDSAYQFYETHQMLQCDYQSLLSIWSGVFGKKQIIVRPYEPQQWLNGDVVQDFCAAVDTVPLRSGHKEHNESLGITQLYIKRSLNRVGFDKAENDAVLEVLHKLCPEKPVKGGSYVHRGLYTKYRQEWLQVNKALSEDYLQGAALFGQPIPIAGDMTVFKVDPYSVGAYVQQMYKVFKSGKYAHFRQLFARAAMLMIAEQSVWKALTPEERATLLGWV